MVMADPVMSVTAVRAWGEWESRSIFMQCYPPSEESSGWVDAWWIPTGAVSGGDGVSDEIAVGTRVRDWEGKTGTVIPVGAAHPYQVPNEVLVRLDEPLYGNRDYFYSVRKLAVIDQEEAQDG
jgi:hypothetical protein